MSFTNLTTNDTFELKVGEPTYIGRHKFGIESKYISERQLKVVLEEDNRCFIKNLSNKKVKLNQALITISTEHQLQNGDEIDLLLDGYKVSSADDGATRHLTSVVSDLPAYSKERT
ncbi:hypothetical protein BD408DRAFT_104663 [Parasitella parasitica]|nr:hypothetical protein BD408DRAFT_104663 [Parasitella parasitica]